MSNEYTVFPNSPVKTCLFRNCLTIRQLKEVIKDWPEVNEYTGQECEVWITTGEGLSSPCVELEPLNRRLDDEKVSADILLTPSK